MPDDETRRDVAQRCPAGVEPRGPNWLAGIVFLSGAAALAHEVVWARILADVFGTTAGATAVVLACFMTGMGAGGGVFGRAADRLNPRGALRLYGALELAAAAGAVLVPFLVWLSGFLYGALFRATDGNLWVLTIARLGLSSAALLLPAFALGGTLPALVRFVAAPRRADCEAHPPLVGFEMGRLYAVNTAGAVAGCFATGYLFVPTFGVLGTAMLAAASSAAAGAAALAIAGRARRDSHDDLATASAGAGDIPPANTGPADGSGRPGASARGAAPEGSGKALAERWLVPALYGVSGFAALGCEVLWTRSLVFLLRTTVYAFAAMLTVFLLGLAAGGALGARLARATRRHGALFAALELGAAVSVAQGLFVLRAFASNWDEIDLALGSGWGVSTALHLAISAAVMLLPTLFLGAIFPVAGALHARRAPPGSATGELYLGNTLGGAAGSLAAGFVLIPLLGTGRAILALACVSLLVAAAAFALLAGAPRALGVRSLAMALVLSAVAFTTLPASATRELFAATISKAELAFAEETAEGVVTVHRYLDSGWRVLSVSGVQVAGTAPPLRSTQILQGLIPTLLHRAPRSVLQVGLGSGETSHVALLAGAERLLCVEIAPGVVRAAREFFADTNGNVLADPRMRVIVADGKSFLRHGRGQFDLILSESTYPFLSGSSGLYTLEYFRWCRRALGEGGIATAWLPLDVPEAGVRSILRTFAEVFPHATLWSTNTYGYKHGLLVGSDEPIVMRYGELRSRAEGPATRALLRLVGIRSPEELAASLMLDTKGVREFGGSSPLHTDDRPVLEYQTSLRSGLHWRARLAGNFEALARHRARSTESVSLEDVPPEERARALESLRRADERARLAAERTAALLRAQAEAFPSLAAARSAAKRGDEEKALELYRKALSICPEDEEARNELGMLLIQAGRLDEARRVPQAEPQAGPTLGGELDAPAAADSP